MPSISYVYLHKYSLFCIAALLIEANLVISGQSTVSKCKKKIVTTRKEVNEKVVDILPAHTDKHVSKYYLRKRHKCQLADYYYDKPERKKEKKFC